MESTPCATTGVELPWNLPLDELLRRLHAKPGGLADRDANRRLAEYGPNDALMHRRRQLWRQIIERLANPLIIILLFASGLSAWTGEVTSFVIIVVIILLSVVLDVAQQHRAENTIDALRRSVGLRTQVLRNGDRREIAVDQLAPGDVVELKAGDVVPGDSRVLTARDCFVNQALLTGEPFPVEKQAKDLAAPSGEPSGAANFLFMGTSVISGVVRAVVCRTGRATELGGLAGELTARRPADAFQQGIRQFGFLMLRLTVFLVLFVMVTNVVFHRPWL
ncbi:MAG TPA: cation-transporting P-type ATPase, partial [Methyloceanibacter sp.]|nr:cation-transporting P-type ATPase [Methyloceanibacter sp.]